MSKLFNLRNILSISGLMVLAILAGCTNEQIYHGVQVNQRNECEKLQLNQREECLKRLAPEDYREYQRERQKLEKQ